MLQHLKTPFYRVLYLSIGLVMVCLAPYAYAVLLCDWSIFRTSASMPDSFRMLSGIESLNTLSGEKDLPFFSQFEMQGVRTWARLEGVADWVTYWLGPRTLFEVALICVLFGAVATGFNFVFRAFTINRIDAWPETETDEDWSSRVSLYLLGQGFCLVGGFLMALLMILFAVVCLLLPLIGLGILALVVSSMLSSPWPLIIFRAFVAVIWMGFWVYATLCGIGACLDGYDDEFPFAICAPMFSIVLHLACINIWLIWPTPDMRNMIALIVALAMLSILSISLFLDFRRVLTTRP